MEKRYRLVRGVARFIQILAVIVWVPALFIAFAAFQAGSPTLGLLWTMFTSISPLFVIAAAELVFVMLDIEENTRLGRKGVA